MHIRDKSIDLYVCYGTNTIMKHVKKHLKKVAQETTIDDLFREIDRKAFEAKKDPAAREIFDSAAQWWENYRHAL